MEEVRRLLRENKIFILVLKKFSNIFIYKRTADGKETWSGDFVPTEEDIRCLLSAVKKIMLLLQNKRPAEGHTRMSIYDPEEYKYTAPRCIIKIEDHSYFDSIGLRYIIYAECNSIQDLLDHILSEVC